MLSRRNILCAMSAAAVPPPARAVPTRVIVPAYFAPHVRPGLWERIADARLRCVVLNVASGPGTAPDPVFARASDRIAARRGTVAAYVDVSYGRRETALVLADLKRYRRWYGVADVFFDQVPSGPDGVAYMKNVTDRARDAGAGLVVFNHGTHPDPTYLTLADVLVTFEGPVTAYAAAEPPAWTLAGDPARFCHLVYGCRPEDLEVVTALARRRNTGVLYVTDRAGANPYDGLPSYFERLVGG
ncbi:spherulation-specific family 4 protein [Actinocorallia sp. A-T 12471]|uniref:spherulation-specific family 4 protein n=1 Tax=Actinocorallia sp. A-T 12471 TaxID=3089813 RepID=UPI0029CAF7D1|nr:spherulation-specific family 4 protein [Actinocorallia sp. A-T 12471]MDX6743760.1 spherulation-specific family 4 protein [Actinocorallia sp. A-T 12471]